jgi:hypothetical protein
MRARFGEWVAQLGVTYLTVPEERAARPEDLTQTRAQNIGGLRIYGGGDLTAYEAAGEARVQILRFGAHIATGAVEQGFSMVITGPIVRLLAWAGRHWWQVIRQGSQLLLRRVRGANRGVTIPVGRLRYVSGGGVIAGAHDNGAFMRHVQNVRPRPGYFDVASHGNATELFLRAADGSRLRSLSAREAAEAIRAMPGYTQGTPVRLIACDAGSLDNGFAAQLARELNTTVLAPTRRVWVAPGSREVQVYGSRTLANGVVERNFRDPGSWRSFAPGG